MCWCQVAVKWTERLLIVLTLLIAVTGTCWTQGREGRTGRFEFITFLDLKTHLLRPKSEPDLLLVSRETLHPST